MPLCSRPCRFGMRAMPRERLQKVIASAGLASRRRAEDLIASGAVSVNGILAHLGDLADPDVDEIMVNGKLLAVRPRRTYLALNKPPGYVSSLRSTHGELTVSELVPSEPRLFPVGRLDRDTSGLLLMTDDGDWSNLVTHPRFGIEKEYRVLVLGKPSRDALNQLRHGVTLPDGAITAPALVERIGDDRGNSWLTVSVIEGKKRQIRLMAAAVGYPVLELRRVRVGPIVLGSLPEGSWRSLAAEEVDEVRDIARHRPARSGPRTGLSR